MTTKTKEEMEAEREEALQNINTILDKSRPKNLQSGVSSGVSNILQGAVGAVGVAVLLPTLGLATGIKQGGILGGVVGVTAGVVIGAVGAVALALGGKKMRTVFTFSENFPCTCVPLSHTRTQPL
jgi:TRAP-type mannitol/chloroaromatic compound transport system permease large subunit